MRRPNICLIEIQEVKNGKNKIGTTIGEIVTEEFPEVIKDINKLNNDAGSKTTRLRGR